MKTAKLFKNGRSQAVRLPKEYRFEGDEVYIKKTDKGVLLIAKDSSLLDIWEKNLKAFGDEFMPEREQLEEQKREGLDELFD